MAPNEADTHVALAYELAKTANFKDAMDECHIASKMWLGYPDTMDRRGYIFRHRGDAQEAILWYRKALEKTPTNVGCHERLADALRKTHADLGADQELKLVAVLKSKNKANNNH